MSYDVAMTGCLLKQRQNRRLYPILPDSHFQVLRLPSTNPSSQLTQRLAEAHVKDHSGIYTRTARYIVTGVVTAVETWPAFEPWLHTRVPSL